MRCESAPWRLHTREETLSLAAQGSEVKTSENPPMSTGQGLTRKESKAAEELVEFVGSVEVGLKFAGGKALAKVIEAAGEKIESGGNDFLIGEYDVAPGGV